MFSYRHMQIRVSCGRSAAKKLYSEINPVRPPSLASRNSTTLSIVTDPIEPRSEYGPVPAK